MDIITKENGILDLYADNGDLFNDCENYIIPNLWSNNINKQRYEIAKGNHAKGIKTDTLLMSNSLIKTGYSKVDIKACLGKPDYRLEKNIVEYIKDLFDDYVKRTMKPILVQKHRELNSEIGDSTSALEDLKNAINDIDSIKNNLSVEKSILEIHDEAFAQLLEDQNSERELVGYSTGLTDLDKITNGLKQEVILVLAPPGCGKSSLMVNIIKHVAIKQKKTVMVFSVEMPSRELIKNIWANALEINSDGIRKAKLSDANIAKIQSFRDMVKEERLMIDDTPAITWQYVETKVRKMRRKVPISELIVVIIDYIQLMSNSSDEYKGSSSEERLGFVAKGLMEIQKKYNVCMIELSQIGRDKLNGGNNKPKLSDGKGSGALEACAVQAWGLYRADYFEKDPTEDGMSLKGLCEINILKNRYGDKGKVFTKFKGYFSAFENYNPEGITANNDSEAF